MFDINEFVSKPKSLLIAPAGYGKTHTIAECLKYTAGTQLVLTHTHAGVASLKEKIKKSGITSAKFHIETIDSFAQKYVNAFYCKNDIPPQEDNKKYFPFIIKQATRIIKIKPIKDIINATYTRLFVDEYQDCAKTQHRFIIALADILPVHLLGDPLQGIFYFSEELINWETDLNEFANARFELTEPWRWKNTNQQLGSSLKEIRRKLENNENIDLSLYSSTIKVLQINEDDISKPGTIYNRTIWSLLKEENVLIIHPETHLNARKKFVINFNGSFRLLEAIDHKDFYKIAKEFDRLESCENIYNKLIIILKGRQVIRNKRKKRVNTLLTGLGYYFKDDKNIPNPRKEPLKSIVKNLKQLEITFNSLLLSKTLRSISKVKNVKFYRKELFSDLCKALEQAEYQKISVYESMENIRNVKRRMGRKIEGKCIGTTLLTKGLEFDTVAILNAHKFNCPKNLYVALTRASKKLIIFTTNKILSPYKVPRRPDTT